MISALVFGGRLNWLRLAWARGDATPLVCRATIGELMVALSYPKFRLDAQQRQAALAAYVADVEVVELPQILEALPARCRDEADEVFIQLALAGGADFLVTGDRDLLALRGLLAVEIVTPAAFKSRLGG